MHHANSHQESDHSKSEKTIHGSSIAHVDLNNISDINSLVEAWEGSGVFSSGHLARAVSILVEAKQSQAKLFAGISGALIPGGMRRVISQSINDGLIDVITTTGANITHDVIEAIGGGHVKDVAYKSDEDLLNRGIDRVWDAFVKEGSFESFEDFMKEFLEKLWREHRNTENIVISPSDLIRKIGLSLSDPNSFVKCAADKGVPIFVPAISDSVLGLQIWLFSQFHNFTVDPIIDLGKIQEEFSNSETNCALLLGGGVPKNYTLQAALMHSKNFDFAVQITLDRVETGGLSGASLGEAISWGKIEPTAKYQTVVCDITIALPIIMASLRSRLEI